MSEETTKNEVSKGQEMRTVLSVATNNYMQVIKKQMNEGGATFDEYSGKCVMSAMAAINNMIHGKGLTFNDLNSSNVNEILIQIATLKLNANAVPRECYFQVRNVNVGGKGQQEQWEKQIEMGIEGDGNDAILARFGRDVKKVCQVWLVREKDKFVYPKHNGLEMTAPQWEPTGQGEVIRVVYPIIKTDNTVEYYIGERRDVVKNLYAHISNNMMNETFGLVKSGKKTRYDATPEEKKKINAKKKELMSKARSLGDLDKILDCEELSPYISPAWKEYQSREQMIIRKMRNNVTKKIPKDFDSALTAEQYNMMDDTYREVHAEIEDFANSTVFDTDFKEVPESDHEPESSQPVEEKEEPSEKKEPAPEKEEPNGADALETPEWLQ
jgi:hypothetical protein